MAPAAASAGKTSCSREAGSAPTRSTIDAVEHVDAGVDRTGCALARRNEGSNPIAVEQDPAVAVADDVGAQGHVNEAGVGARDQIEDIEVEE